MSKGYEVFMKSCQESRVLSEKNRRDLCNLIVDLLVDKAKGLYPNLVTKTSLAKATVSLFPTLKYKDSRDGIVC